MIISFADKETERLFVLGVSRKLPSTIINTALRKLDYLNRAKDTAGFEITDWQPFGGIERRSKR